MVSRSAGGPGARFAGLDELLIDGHNLLHRTAGGAGPVARHELLARLRATLPPGIRAVVVLDGPPDPGAPLAQRVSPQLEVRHSGRSDADGLIVALVQARPAAVRVRVAVVSDDRALRDRVRQQGGATYRLAWLTDVLRPLRPAVPPAAPGTTHRGAPDLGEEGEAEREPWAPGRGATTKHGNPRRGAVGGARRGTRRRRGRTV
jgi:hypothetical protein